MALSLISCQKGHNDYSKGHKGKKNSFVLNLNLKKQKDLVTLFRSALNNQEISDYLNEEVKSKIGNYNEIQKNSFKQKNILIFDEGMTLYATNVFRHRIAGFYRLDRFNGDIELIYPETNIARWYQLMFPGMDQKDWPLHSPEMLQLKDLVMNKDSRLNNNSLTIGSGHGDPIMNLLGETTTKAQIVVVQDTENKQNFNGNFGCHQNLETQKVMIKNYFLNFSHRLAEIVTKHNIGYMNASWGIDAQGAAEVFNSDCYVESDRPELIQFYMAEYNNLFKAVIDRGVLVFQASTENTEREVTNPLVDNLSVEERYRSDCEKIEGRYRVGNLRLGEHKRYTEILKRSQQDQGIFFDPSLSYFELDLKTEAIYKNCVDFFIARENDDLQEMKNGLAVTSNFFYSFPRRGSSSYITPFLLSWVVNQVESGVLSFEKVPQFLSHYNQVLFIEEMKKKLLDQSSVVWPYELSKESQQILNNSLSTIIVF